ncbi:hypothetical protein E9993_01440 [Labilibacter sediminis]|nr:hypothetical protein E9993_01440 [Labilibacter sediminis]
MKVVISGIGAHCALGSSTKELWDNIQQGKSGIRPITRFDVVDFKPKLGGMVQGGDDYESNEKRLLAYALIAAKEALYDAGITGNNAVTLVLGTSNAVRGKKINNVSYSLANELKLGGQVITVSTACTSSSHAIGFGADLLRRGKAKLVIAGGVDILNIDVFAGFHCLGLLSTAPCSPFSNSLGTTLGEGGGFLVMETEASAKQRGIVPKAVFMGYGTAADAFHDTRPDPSGSGIQKAITAALKDSNLKPQDIDYINAHGTGTAANDSAEWRGIQNALSDRASQIPVSSSKSFLGHAQGAAGVLEAITTISAMLHYVIPHTLNYSRPRPFSPIDPVAATCPRPHQTRFALCTNSAFGGLNTALIFGSNDMECQAQRKTPRSISILGHAVNFDKDYINKHIPFDDLRNTDLAAKLLAGVVAKLLNNAEIQFRSNECENTGLFVGQDDLSEDSLKALQNSIRDRGMKHLSAAAFTRLVVNYPASVCCRLFGLKGPVAALAERPDNGMTALCLAADTLAWRDGADVMIVASVDTHNDNKNTPAGAVGILLKAQEGESPLCLTKWSMSGLTLNSTSFPDTRGLYTLIETLENSKKVCKPT